MIDFLQTTQGILTAASAYLLVGLGWNIVYNACGYLNLAIGGFYVLGAVVAYEAETSLGLTSFLVVGALVVLVAGGVGAVAERVTLRPLSDRGLAPMLVTLGLALVLLQLAAAIVPVTVIRPAEFVSGPPLDLGGVLIGRQELIVWVTAAALTTALVLFFKRTDLGRTMRACADNGDGARMLGVNVDGFATMAFAIGAALAAVAAFVVAPAQGVSYASGEFIAIKAFMAVSIGGIGRYGGAVVGALVVAAAEGYIARYWNADVRDVVVLSAFLLILYVQAMRPRLGVLGRRVR